MTQTKITDKGYFLGVSKENMKVYLSKPSWDCDWYWGFGYLEYYNNNGRPSLQVHTHWDYELSKVNMHAFDYLKNNFNKLTLSDDDLWKLCDFMKSFYTLKEMAELVYMGYSHYTEDAHKVLDLKDKAEYEKINKELLPKLFEQIDLLFR